MIEIRQIEVYARWFRRLRDRQAAMETIRTRPWDPAEHLETSEDMAAYLSAALDDGDPGLILDVLHDIYRARRMKQDFGLEGDSSYESLSSNGNPEFTTVLKAVRAMGLRGCVRSLVYILE